MGHTESVSGITGIMKVILSMKNEIIPRHLNFETLNPDIRLDTIPAKIPLEETAWPRIEGKPRLAGVSSFGISGTDGHIIVQEAPVLQSDSSLSLSTSISSKYSRPLHIMKISAKTQESFDELIRKYQELFAENPENVDFADYAYTANVGRATFPHRGFVVAKDTAEAAAILKQKTFFQKEVQSSGKKVLVSSFCKIIYTYICTLLKLESNHVLVFLGLLLVYWPGLPIPRNGGRAL